MNFPETALYILYIMFLLGAVKLITDYISNKIEIRLYIKEIEKRLEEHE